MDVRVVKVLDSGVTVTGEEMNGRTKEPRGITNCPDRPSKKMVKALDELTQVVPGIMGLDAAVGLVRVYGVTYAPKGAGGTVVFHLKLASAQGDIATNSLPFFTKVESESASVLPDTVLRVVTRLMKAAEEYHSSDREQLDFSFEGGTITDPEPPKQAAAGGE